MDEDKLRHPPTGKKFQECFDATTGTPCKEYAELDGEIRKEFAEQFGLKSGYASPYL